MKRKFTVVVKKKGDEFEARCEDVGVYTLGRDREDTLKRLKIAIFRKLNHGGDSSGGSAPKPHPVTPPPRSPLGPLTAEIELDDDGA